MPRRIRNKRKRSATTRKLPEPGGRTKVKGRGEKDCSTRNSKPISRELGD